MCDNVLREIKKKDDKTSQDHCSESDASEMSKRKDFRDVESDNYEEFLRKWPPALSTWCPRAGMYYAYTEDANPFDRIDEFIENERKNSHDQSRKIHFEPPQDPFTIRDPYEDNDAREKYLRTDPVCFAIFGKPNSNSDKLAKLIAEWWKCILISPELLVHEEIEKNTEKGRWIADSFRNDETLGPNVIMNLIESRINERDVKHRGYVVEGLPLIPINPEVEYSTCPEDISTDSPKEKCCKVDDCHVTSETASISSSSSTESLKSAGRTSSYGSVPLMPFQRAKILMSARVNLLRRTTVLETLRKIEGTTTMQTRVNPFVNDSRTSVPSEKYQDYIPKEIEMIFNSWPIKPTIIIYIACPDEDATERRQYFSFDPFIGRTIDTRFHDTREGQFDDERLEKRLLESVDETASVKLRCEIYKRYAMPVIERQVLRHNPQNVIRLDGRTSISQMFEIISTKLLILPFSRATRPKRIWEYDEGDEESENYPEDNSDDEINERVFEKLARTSTISSKFRLTLSNWKFTCPVELAKGRTIEGKAEYAVRFMNKIFFLSSIEAMEIFLENPRPFIASMRPRVTCKMAIFGPSHSGKSELSDDLGRNFGVKVVDFRGLVKGMIDDQIERNVANGIREARTRVIENLRFRLENERQRRENARLETLGHWIKRATKIIREFIEFDGKMLSDDEAEYSELSEFANIDEKLYEYGLEFLKENRELAERLKDNETMIHDYAPDHLSNEEAPIRELSEHDPEVATMLENEVKHLRNAKIEITNGEIAESLISRIKMMADEPVDGELTREPGWIVDGMYPDPEIWTILTRAGVIFENLILITDESPYKNLLLNWKRYYETKNELLDDEDEFDGEYIDDSAEIRDMENYIADIKDFDEKWQNFSELLEETSEDYFACNFDETSKMYEIVSKRISDRYRFEAKIMTDEERDGGFEDTIESITDIDEEELEDHERVEESTGKQTNKDNRPLGDTGLYCPVALARNKVLRKGKDEYCATFLDKIYLCSSAEALEDFVKNPEACNVPFKKPMKPVPFPRISIVGPPGSGKSTLAKILSKEYEMTHVDFSNCLKTYMSDRGIIPVDLNDEDRSEEINLPLDLNDKKYNVDEDTIVGFFQKYNKEGASLPKKMLDECFLNFFKAPYENCGVIFDSFPNCLEDVEIVLENYAIPELVIELECSLEKAQERLLPELLKSFMKKRKIDGNNEAREASRVPVPDARFDYLCEYFKPASKVPAFLNVVDIAGLVKGAAEGQGLGNAFLSHISACDAIFHLCRAFEDDDVTHIEGEVNPVRDLEIICEELRLKDIEFLGVHLEKLEKLVVRGNDKKLKPEYDTLLKVKNILHEEKKHIRFADWSVNEIEILNKYLFLTSKPVIYLVNLSEKDYIRKKNKWLIKIKEWVDKNDPGASLIPFSGAFENKVIDMNEAERAKYFEESKVTSALDKIIVQGYKALQLQYFFTSGADEVKAWTIQKGFKAPQAAGRIHTDFEKGFIMAEVMKFDDFKNEGSESGVKAAGKYRQQGRNYVVEDGDIIFFKFNAGAGLKDAKKK